MRKAIYPGSFDPITNGHLDVIERASHLFDEVVVAVAVDGEKKGHHLFSANERVSLIQSATSHLENVTALSFAGLLVTFAKNCGTSAIIRGLRAVSDFEYEFQMAPMNRKLEPEVETLFLMPREDFIYLSSRLVREIGALGGDITDFVPEEVRKALSKKFTAQGP